MKLSRMRLAAAVIGLSLAGAAPAQNAAYPIKPVRGIVGFAPGGGTDLMARSLAVKLTDAFGQQVIIDNRAGGGGVIAATLAKDAPPDGYTIFFGTISTLAANVAVNPKLPYDPLRDFAPITMTSYNPYFLVVHPSVPAKTVKEFIALARAKPGQLNYASSGTGGGAHLALELFRSMAKLDMVHVPYKGAAPAMQALLAGDTQLMFDNLANAMAQVKAGTLRALAVTTAERSKLAPELPTMAEAGVAGFDTSTWFGLFAPAGTPPEIIGKWNADVVRILDSPEMRERLVAQGAEAAPDSPADFARFVASELAKYARIVKASGAKVD
jgi:tripartite-type tricarboxylate transporter receptor subunit TctC